MAMVKKFVDWDLLTRALKAGATIEAASRALGLSSDTVTRRCIEEKGITIANYATECRAIGDNTILLTYYEGAIKEANYEALKFLLKNRLGYADKVESKQEITMANEIELRIEAPND